MRVLLVFANPHQAVPVSPYGLDIIRADLAAYGDIAEVRTVNPFIESLDAEARLQEVLEEFQPDLIGMSIRNVDNSVVAVGAEYPRDGAEIDVVPYGPAIKELCAVIRGWNPDVPCVAGGAAFTACPRELLDYLDLEFGLIGAAERSFTRLVATLAARCPPYAPQVAAAFTRLPGAIHRRGAAGFHTVPARPALHDEPAGTPAIAPEYELLYRLRGIPVAVRTKTGCPLRCAYCIDPLNMRTTDRRPIEHVLADLTTYVEEYGLTSFHIADAELNLPYEDHVLALCEGLKRTGLHDRLRWRGYFNVLPASDRLLDALVSAGCRTPSFAIDSFDPDGLREHRKNFRVRHVHDLLDRLLARGATPEICLLLGRPGETLQSLETNIDMMLRYADQGVRIAYSCGIRVYPGTPLARRSLDPRHLYVGHGPQDGPLAPRAYCEPLAPRALAAHVAARVGGHENIQLFTEAPWPEATHATALRHFNVGIQRMSKGSFAESAAYLDKALELAPDLTPATRALALVP